MSENDIKPGYVYHIKDSYFDLAQDDKLMKNREGGAFRPTYYCLKDEKTGLAWVVPMSRRVEKYEDFIKKEISRYGKCYKIVIGEYLGINAVFLLQNMFPILPKYIAHAHLVKQTAIAVDLRLQAILSRNFREILRLNRMGIKVVFPDITRLEKLMLDEKALTLT